MRAVRTALDYGVLCLCSVLLLFPMVYALLMSFMDGAGILAGHLWPDRWEWVNYQAAFEQAPLGRYLFNSVLVASVITVGRLIVSSLAAFAFVFLRFPGRDLWFYVCIATMLVPWEATVIPNFLTIQQLGWTNDYLGLTVPFWAMAFGIFLLRQQFRQIPYELYEAARLSGIGNFRFFCRVVLPLSKTGLVTLAVYSFLDAWNMYLWPLLVTNDDRFRTVQIGLKQLQTQEIASSWGVVMAAAVVAMLPTLLLLFAGQKQLRKGFMQGAIQ
ncbi:glycerol-3-phosphate ABC transporter permease [Geobacillus subterraneus]|uniref:Glycerol-3-phosphate ABC transporter permease n=2 Tax=Geobacillus TaxID=129337 RepID=A0ABN4NFX3_9BACL|nr:MULTISPECIES: carbohydrate ABC transporter permease [Geobacillus]AMX83372.1 glycerol-3-phosphate ABC transporter permease [Geobacillus subterraneus]KZS24625.1 glycerol-3-phosphate ABC transporter permease [Geobacillus subterraneus]OXB90396.1 glycerol-3-phosphate ABC transporter permease [Geobacillus uzenensis]QIZ68008.1 carbohydrate ABC transporter permease [Geobacillus subterraneus]